MTGGRIWRVPPIKHSAKPLAPRKDASPTHRLIAVATVLHHIIKYSRFRRELDKRVPDVSSAGAPAKLVIELAGDIGQFDRHWLGPHHPFGKTVVGTQFGLQTFEGRPRRRRVGPGKAQQPGIDRRKITLDVEPIRALLPKARSRGRQATNSAALSPHAGGA